MNLSKHLLSIFFVLFFGGLAQGQVFLPKRCYMHMNGVNSDSIHVTLHLVKIYDSIYADVLIQKDSVSCFVVGGGIKEDGSFLIHDPFNDSLNQIKGLFVTRKTLSATLLTEDGKKEIPIDFVETYPDGSLPFMVYYDHDSLKVTENTSTAHATIQQCMILPGTSASPVISDTLRQSMSTNFLTEPAELASADVLMDGGKQQFFNNFEESTIPLLQSFPDAGNVNWILLKFMHILFNDRNIISCYTLNYGYTGGAHGMEMQDHSVISVKDGKPVKLHELFVRNYTDSLSRLLTSNLKEQLSLSEDAKLTDHGFYEEEIPPSNNFYLLSDGIGFYYNHYEIAPYVNGPTNIFVPFSELKSIIRTDSVIGMWLDNR
jgi:hypothetical protein